MFKMIVNKFQYISIKIKVKKNWLIYQFYINLNKKDFSYFEKYF